MIKAVLFDADGVTIISPDNFSRMYAVESGLDPDELEDFFDEGFAAAMVGKADLKELIVARNDLWRWHDTPEKLLDKWFEAENHPNKPVVAEIKAIKAKGLSVFLATNQEKYRAKFLREVMFTGVFDQIFVSCELGCKKPSAQFFEAAMSRISAINKGIDKSEVAYFDDDQRNVDAAKQFGFDAHLFKDVAQIREVLAN